MQRKTNGGTACPIARSLDRVGDGWSILILRDAFYGISRFDTFQKSLDIAPNILTRRLNSLVEAGLLEKKAYQTRPVRYDYVLTDRGRDFRIVIQGLIAWGTRHFAPEGPGIEIRDTQTGRAAEPIMVDALSGRPLSDPVFRVMAGPAADEGILRRLALRDALRDMHDRDRAAAQTSSQTAQ